MDMSVALTSDGRIAAELRNAGVPVTILGEARISRPLHGVARAARARLAVAIAAPRRHRLPSGVAACALWSCCKTPFHRARPLDAYGGQPALARPARMARKPWHGRLQQPVYGVDAAEVERPRRSGVCARRDRPARVDREAVFRRPCRHHPGQQNGAAGRDTTVLLDALAQLRDRAEWTCRLAGGAQRAA